jgi:hypothetical protein
MQKIIAVENRGTCGCVRCNKEKEGVKMEFFFSLNILFSCLQERKKFVVADGSKCTWMRRRCNRMMMCKKRNCRDYNNCRITGVADDEDV